MKRYTAGLLAALLLLTAGYRQAAEEPTPTPIPGTVGTPIPVPTPTPAPPELKTVEDLLSAIDEGLQADAWDLRGWMDPGSGPSPYTLYAAPCRDKLKELLTSVAWQEGPGKKEPKEWEQKEWEYNVDLSFGSFILRFQPAYDRLTCINSDGETCAEFHADGVKKVAHGLLKLWPGALFRYQLVGVPTASNWKTEARSYAKAFEEDYLASGHITDFHLDSIEFTQVESDEEIFAGNYITLNFTVTPANPADPAWEDAKGYIDQPWQDGEGKFHFSQKLRLTPMSDGYSRPRCPY